MRTPSIKAARARLEQNLLLELICSDLLPAAYRRDLLRQESSTLDDTSANDFLERVFGRLDHDDPLVMLMMQKA